MDAAEGLSKRQKKNGNKTKQKQDDSIACAVDKNVTKMLEVEQTETSKGTITEASPHDTSADKLTVMTNKNIESVVPNDGTAASEQNSQLGSDSAGDINESPITGINETSHNETHQTSINETNKSSSNKLHLPDEIIKKGNVFFCNICNIDVNSFQTVASHVNGKKHKKQYETLRSITTEAIQNENFCEEDQVEYHLTFMQPEANTELTIKNDQTTRPLIEESDETNLLDNRSSEVAIEERKSSTSVIEEDNNELNLPARFTKGSDFFCEPSSLEFSEYGIVGHSKEASYKERVQIFPKNIVQIKENQTSIDETNPYSNNEFDATDEITNHGNLSFCKVCHVEISSSPIAISKHVNGRKHIRRCETLRSDTIETIQNENFCREDQVNITLTIKNDHTTRPFIEKSDESSLLDNESSEVAVEERKSNNKLNLPAGFIKKGNAFFCELCNLEFPEYRTVIDHSKETSHKEGVQILLKDMVQIKGMYKCTICNTLIGGCKESVMAHRETKHHKENEAQLNSSLSTTISSDVKLETQKDDLSASKNIASSEIMQIHYGDMMILSIECKICKVHIRQADNTSIHQKYADHMESKEHKTKESEFTKNWHPPQENISDGVSLSPRKIAKAAKHARANSRHILSCSFCSKIVEGSFEFHAHLTNHFLSRFIMKSEENPENLRGKRENEDSNIEVETLEAEVFEQVNNLNFINEVEIVQQKSLYVTHQVKPLDVETDNGLNMYEMNKEKKEDLQLGVLLMFAVNEKSLYCLVCRKTVKKTVEIVFDHLCSISHLAYLQEMIEDHRKFKNYINQLSDFALAHEYMEDVGDLSVTCHACIISVPNDTTLLNEHIRTASHVKIWSDLAKNAKTLYDMLSPCMHYDFYSVKKYWCVPCKSKFSIEMEFCKHIYAPRHLSTIERFQAVGEQLIFDYCAICATVWFGFHKTFDYHSTCPMHKHYSNQGFNFITRLPLLAERLVRSTKNNVDKLVEQIDNMQIENAQNESRLMRDMEMIYREKYPNCVAYLFGSRVTKQGGSNSDLDIFLDCDAKEYPLYEGQHFSPDKIKERLNIIKSCLEENPSVWLIDYEILEARTPIIKARHLPTSIKCDISFSNGLTVESSKLIRGYCEKYPNCRKMIIFLKNWTKYCQLTGLSGINSYAVTWMVIFFLQRKGILPSVHNLIRKKNQSRLISGWETGIDHDFNIIDTEETIERLFRGFFTFYANFDYRNEVICPFFGRSVKKAIFDTNGQVPIEMKTYVAYLMSGSDREPFRFDSFFCVQDPYDLQHNVTKAVKKSLICRLKSFCLLSAEILKHY